MRLSYMLPWQPRVGIVLYFRFKLKIVLGSLPGAVLPMKNSPVRLSGLGSDRRSEHRPGGISRPPMPLPIRGAKWLNR
jgi:hypothetical protein